MKIANDRRRILLKSAGISLTLPAIQSLPRRSAASEPLQTQSAQTQPATSSAKAKRLICIGSNLVLYRNALYPETPGRDYEVTKSLQPLMAHRNDFTLFSGFDHRASNGHANWDNYLCGPRIGSEFMDQIAAASIGTQTRFESLQLCAGDIPKQRMVYRRGGVPLPMVNRPNVVLGTVWTIRRRVAAAGYVSNKRWTMLIWTCRNLQLIKRRSLTSSTVSQKIK